MEFDRREFIAAFFSMGATTSTLTSLQGKHSTSSEAEVWREIEEHPIVFSVDKLGTLEVVGELGPSCRWEAYDLWTQGEAPSLSELVEAIRRVNSAFDAVRDWKLDKFDEDKGKSDSGLKDELQEYGEYLIYPKWHDELGGKEEAIEFVCRLSFEHYQELAQYMRQWASSCNFGPEEWEEFDYPASGQDSAFRFFHLQDYSFADALGVNVIEGDRPGSNYYAAELSVPIEEANFRAVSHGVPLRFERSVDV